MSQENNDRANELLYKLNYGESITEEDTEYLLLHMYGPDVLKVSQRAKRDYANMSKDPGLMDGFLIGKVCT